MCAQRPPGLAREDPVLGRTPAAPGGGGGGGLGLRRRNAEVPPRAALHSIVLTSGASSRGGQWARPLHASVARRCASTSSCGGGGGGTPRRSDGPGPRAPRALRSASGAGARPAVLRPSTRAPRAPLAPPFAPRSPRGRATRLAGGALTPRHPLVALLGLFPRSPTLGRRRARSSRSGARLGSGGTVEGVGTWARRGGVLAPAWTLADAGSDARESRSASGRGGTGGAGLKKGEEAWVVLCCRWRRSRRRQSWRSLLASSERSRQDPGEP